MTSAETLNYTTEIRSRQSTKTLKKSTERKHAQLLDVLNRKHPFGNRKNTRQMGRVHNVNFLKITERITMS